MLVSLGVGYTLLSSVALDTLNKYNGNSLSLAVKDPLGPMMIYALSLSSNVGDSFANGLVVQGGRQIVRGTDVFGSQESAEHSLSQFRLTYEPSLRILPFPTTLSRVNFAKKIEKRSPLLSFHLGVLAGLSLISVSSSIKSVRDDSEVAYTFVNTGFVYGGATRLTLAWPRSKTFEVNWELEAQLVLSQTVYGYGANSRYLLESRDREPPADLKVGTLSKQNWVERVIKASIRVPVM